MGFVGDFVWLLIGIVSFTNAIRICPTLKDYKWWFNPHCHYNPISQQNISEIIHDWGFHHEEHYVTTEDGYQLLIQRVHSKVVHKYPILIVHGIAMSPLAWVIKEKNSLAYLLAIQGYDVWMLNYRGILYSQRHVTLQPEQDEFWKFNINDLGVHDVRSAVKHVYHSTKQQVMYIGYSMGTTGFFIYSSTFPNYAKEQVKGMIGLAPVINYRGVKSAIKYIVPFWPLLKKLIYTLWHGQILPGFSFLLRPFVQLSHGIRFIQMITNVLFGDDSEQLDPEVYPLFITKLLDTVGAEVLTHYIQIYQAGQFQNYDHGEKKNLEIYGTATPPAYDLSKVPVPVSLFVGENDWLATPTNAEQIFQEIPASSRCGYHVVPFKKWNHVDFLVGKDLRKYLYTDLFQVIENMMLGECAKN